MKRFIACLLLSLLLQGSAFASLGDDAIEILFSQEIVAIDASGTLYEPVIIDPARISGVCSYDYDLGRGRSLRVMTNLQGAGQDNLPQLAQVVRQSYDFIETMTGGSLNKGVLLYLIEFENVPISYRFEATYPATAPWQEVRVVLLNRGETLLGATGSADLAELLYDTLPHELGHDVLADISPLLHDIDGQPSHHTRWFIEGVCELLAKQYAQQEAPEVVSRFLAMRNVDEVFDDASVRNALFHWAQQNDNGMALESDLYGAAMLLLMAWTESVELSDLLAQIDRCSRSLCGFDLEQLMEASTGQSRQEIVKRAEQIGDNFSRSGLLSGLPRAGKIKG